MADSPLLSGKYGRTRPQISRKPFEEKLAQLQNELSELTQFVQEGFDVSKLEKETKEQINHLMKWLNLEK